MWKNQSEYERSIMGTAKEIISNGDEIPSEDYMGEYNARIHEEADNAVIYTHRCMDILRFSSNENAAFDHVGIEALDGKETFSGVMTVLAYYAYSQDLSEVVYGFSDDEAHEIIGHHQCEECDEWHDDEDGAAECCDRPCNITFHVEIDDDHYNEANLEDNPEEVYKLEGQAIAAVGELFKAQVKTHSRRNTDGALICSFKSESMAKVRKTIDANRMVEGNDIQIVTGPVTVFDFEDSDGEPVWNEGGE